MTVRKLEPDEARPRVGELTRPDGTRVPVVFEQDPDDSTMFRALTEDGAHLVYHPGVDALRIDALGAGQRLMVDTFSPSDWVPSEA